MILELLIEILADIEPEIEAQLEKKHKNWRGQLQKELNQLKKVVEGKGNNKDK